MNKGVLIMKPGKTNILFTLALSIITTSLCFSHADAASGKPKPLNSANTMKLNTSTVKNSHIKGAFVQQYVHGEVIVKFKNTTNYQIKSQSIAAIGHTMLKNLVSTSMVHVKLKENESVEHAIQAYKNNPNVEYAQPNYIYHIFSTPNDSSYGQLWGLNNTGQTITGGTYPNNNPGTTGCDIDAESAWDKITDCSSVMVAVIDTGVNYNHEDLADNMWDGSASGYNYHGYDFVNSDYDPMDFNGHGTHVAGIIGAVGNNAKGVTGVCWNVKIMAVRVLNAVGEGTTANIVSGINFAVSKGAKVINMSLGGNQSDTAFSNAITNAQNNGVLVIVAAGNEGYNLNTAGKDSYPCEYTQDNIVCVAALDQAYALADFSNYGATGVDVGAPGTNIASGYFGSYQVITTDDFSSGWGLTGWAQQANLGGFPALTDPTNFNYSNEYLAYANHKAYKSFSLSGYTNAILLFEAYIDIEGGCDFFSVNYKIGTGDPFVTGQQLLRISGSFSNPWYHDYYSFPFDISSYVGTNCSIGFRLQSDNSYQYTGVAIRNFAIVNANTSVTNTYEVMDGTSMASPYVAGLAAMLIAFNPNYTYQDAANALKNGGETVASLAGITTTGKAINAWGSLKYINTPAGLSAQQIQ